MNIGFDAKRLYCNFTGLGNYSRTLVKNLEAAGTYNHYSLYTPKIISTPETDYFSESKFLKTRLPSSSPNWYWRTYGIKKQLKKDGIDLYHGLSNEIPIGIEKTNVKTVVTIHDLIFKKLPETFPLIDRTIYNFKFKNSCLHADRIIAISQNTKKDIIKHYKIPAEKIEVIYQPCNSMFYAATDRQYSDQFFTQNKIPENYLLYVGSVEKRKNLYNIIAAYKHLPAESQIPLVIVGRRVDLKYKRKVLDLINHLQIENQIIWLDQVYDNLHLKELYSRAELFLYPSYYEGFGLPVVEALLCRTPVITSDTSSLREAGGPYSRYIDPFSSESIAQELIQLLDHSSLRTELKQKGLDYAHAHFHPRATTDQVLHCYAQTTLA